MAGQPDLVPPAVVGLRRWRLASLRHLFGREQVGLLEGLDSVPSQRGMTHTDQYSCDYVPWQPASARHALQVCR